MQPPFVAELSDLRKNRVTFPPSAGAIYIARTALPHRARAKGGA